MRNIKLLIFFLLTITTLSYGQSAIGTSGNCITNGDPNLIAKFDTQDARYDCMFLFDSTNDIWYEYDKDLTAGSRWLQIERIPIGGTDGQVLARNASGDVVWVDPQDAAALNYWTKTGNNLGYSLGNVGIGTTTPNYPLDVNGKTRIKSSLEITGDSNLEQLNLTSRSEAVGSYYTSNAPFSTGYSFTPKKTHSAGFRAKGGELHFNTDAGLTVGVDFIPTPRVSILTTGNVGIGTTTPTWAKLQIDNNGDGSRPLALLSDDGSFLMHVEQNSGAGSLFVSNAGGSATVKLNSVGDSYFNSGNVGIGKTTPTAKLDVNSGSSNLIALFESTDTEAEIQLKDPTGTLSIRARNDFRLHNGLGQLLKIGSDGVAIFQNTVEGADATATNHFMTLGQAQSGAASYWTKTGNDLHYLSGKVGIGNNNPLYELDVIGNGLFQDPSDGTKYLFLNKAGIIEYGAGATNPSIKVSNATKDFKIQNTSGNLATFKANKEVELFNNLDVDGNVNITEGNSYNIDEVNFLSSSGNILTDGIINIGNNAGNGSLNTISIGHEAGGLTTATLSTIIGRYAGYTASGANIVAIGQGAGGDANGNYNTFLNYQAGKNSVTDYSFIAGYNAGQNVTGNHNILVGRDAGQNATGGGYNIFQGYVAGTTTTGNNNIGIGWAAMNNSTSSSSIALGYRSNATGTANSTIALGYRSLENNVGDGSIGIGRDAGRNNNGAKTISIGYEAGTATGVTSGNNNINIGYRAGRYQEGGETQMIGSNAGENNKGDYSVGLGSYSLSYNTANRNIGIGYGSGQLGSKENNVSIGMYANQYGNNINSVTIGYNSGRYNNLANNVVIGANSLAAFIDGITRTAPQSGLNATTNQITVTAHGFTNNGGYTSLKLSSDGVMPGGVSTTPIKFKIIDANTLEFISVNPTTQGSGNLTLIEGKRIDNSIVIGQGITDVNSNEIVLGSSLQTRLKVNNLNFKTDATLGAIQNGYALRYNNSTGLIEPSPDSYNPTTFLGLSDTGGSYSGLAGYNLRVNSSENAIEFSNKVRMHPNNGNIQGLMKTSTSATTFTLAPTTSYDDGGLMFVESQNTTDKALLAVNGADTGYSIQGSDIVDQGEIKGMVLDKTTNEYKVVSSYGGAASFTYLPITAFGTHTSVTADDGDGMVSITPDLVDHTIKQIVYTIHEGSGSVETYTVRLMATKSNGIPVVVQSTTFSTAANTYGHKEVINISAEIYDTDVSYFINISSVSSNNCNGLSAILKIL